MKKKIFVISVIAVFCAVIASGTVAYFNAEDTAHNVITSGDVDIKIVEKQLSGGSIVDYPDKPISVMPATNVSKIVSVKSLGQAAYIRVSVEFGFKNSEGEPFELSEETLKTLVSVNIDSENWVEKDGYYYYKTAVAHNTETEPLFDTVSFDGPNITNEYQDSVLDIVIRAEAVQAANNGSDPVNASGWKTLSEN